MLTSEMRAKAMMVIKHKSILIIIMFTLSIFLLNCDDNSRQSSVSCKLQKIAANADCLAEALNERCSFFSCTNPDIRIDIRPANCISLDCETLECESIDVFDENGFLAEMPGLLMDLSVDEETGRPIGVFELDGLEEEVLCSGFLIAN